MSKNEKIKGLLRNSNPISLMELWDQNWDTGIDAQHASPAENKSMKLKSILRANCAENLQINSFLPSFPGVRVEIAISPIMKQRLFPYSLKSRIVLSPALTNRI